MRIDVGGEVESRYLLGLAKERGEKISEENGSR